jgi:hypothetical protein
MPEPQQVHIDAALTNISLAYRNTDFIAEQIAPRVGVRKQSDRYYVYDSARESIRSSNDMRSPGALAMEVDYELSTDSYFCSDHALASAVTDEERENADPAIQPDIDRTEFLTERILLNQEIATQQVMENSDDITGTTLSEGAEWNESTSDPIADVKAARLAVFSASQRRANLMVLPYQVYEVVRNHPAIMDLIKYGGHAVATPEVLAQLFDVDRLLVPRCCVNNAAKGQNPNVQPVWNDTVYLAHVAPRAGLKQVTLAHTFVWSGAAGSTDGVMVERWREHGRKADMIRVQKYYDVKLIAGGAGYRIKNTLA